MATKFLHSLTDDNPDLQKQIGCMTGIFQLFDRQHIITPRRITGHSTKRIPSGGTFEKESSTIYNRSATAEKHSCKHVLERQRLSTESSRASFSSSSRSSSFSSLDFNKTGQTEPFDRIIFPETPSRDPAMSQANTSPQFGRQMLDLREVVKDSMYREAQGLPVKSISRHGAADSLAKHRDSPRPVQLSRANDGSNGQGVNGKQDLPVDLKESLRVLSKLHEAPWYANEPRELSRSSSYQSKDGSSFSLAKEASRFSYDGREMRNVPFESRENSKFSLKSKELPRLSLDSRENSMRNFNSDLPADLYLKFPLKDNGSSNSNAPSLQQKSGTQARPPNVVAKLMGLEALPDSISSAESKRTASDILVEETIRFAAGSSEPSDQCRPIQVSNSAKNLWKEPRSPRWKNPDSVMKPISRFPIEPAPWKQMDGNWSSLKPAFKGMKAPAKSPYSFPSVYSEIEKRIKDLEFSQSGKDLRALKQILEAMQAKGLLETQKEEALNFSTSKDHEQIFTNSTSARMGSQRKLQNDVVSTSTRRGTMSSRNFESQIVIMKPVKLVEKSGIPASSVLPIDDLPSLPKIQGGTFSDSRRRAINSRAAKDQIPKSGSRDNGGNSKGMKSNNRVLKSPQTSIKSPQLPKESSTGSLKSSGSISPRMQQKRQELEKRSRPPIPPSDLSRTRRQPNNRQATESSSPGGRRRQKSMNLQLSDDQLTEITNESRNLSYHENEISARSDGSILSDSRMDVEVTSAKRSPEISSGHCPSMEAAHYLVSDLINKKSMPIATVEEPLAEHPTVAPEYPSPVSVLDSAVDLDDSPSPVKKITKIVRGDESHETNVSNTEECSVVDSLATNAVGPCPASEISRKKLQNVENLVQKLRRLNSSHDEARIDYIASLCDNTNPDHRYISEILLASGLLLRDLGSSVTNFQFDPSGPPINPKLFLVLEQTKGSSTFLKEDCAPEKAVQLRSKQKIHRKLIFDTINEILVRKLAILELSSDPWLRPLKLARKSLNAQKLLRELCSEVELLQGKSSKSSLEDEDDGLKTILWEDVMNRSENWTAFNSEVSSMVLDVERMIFKDLVDEVVIGEAPALRNKPVRRRQLFAKSTTRSFVSTQ